MTLERKVALAGATAVGGLAGRFALGRRAANKSWFHRVETPLGRIGQAEHVSILPLVERLSPSMALRGEAGVSYLVQTPETILLFDCGLGTGKPVSALALHIDASTVTAGALAPGTPPLPLRRLP